VVKGEMTKKEPESNAVSPEIITPIGKRPKKGKWVRFRPIAVN
jgi:hypothetical protein